MTPFQTISKSISHQFNFKAIFSKKYNFKIQDYVWLWKIKGKYKKNQNSINYFYLLFNIYFIY